MSATLPRSGVDRGPEILAIIWTFTTLALVVVSLKIFTRYKIVHDTGLDDFLVFLSMVRLYLCLPFCCTYTLTDRTPSRSWH